MRNKNVIKPIGIKLFGDREERINFIIGNIILTLYMICMVIDSIIILDINLSMWMYDVPISNIMFNKYFIKSIAYILIILFLTLSFYTFTNRNFRFRIYIIMSDLIITIANISEIIFEVINHNQFDIYFVKNIFLICLSIVVSIYIIKSKKVEKIFCK